MVLNITASWLSRRICLFRSANKTFSSNASSLIPKNTKEPFISAHKQIQNGVVYDKKPMQLTLVAGKQYSWCLCGRSHNQPFCDGTHRMQELKITQKPIRFSVEETKTYWLCNCKQTRSRPFCDGTHKTTAVQEQTSIIRQ
ncbi:CDGSH iron-sulfur domain-containing protein 3, mitochondrial [Dendroctonus ponderosae]|uniref:Iron-binding zinc finger CDGSH type domain-containing protein n=1 Tax=Dendroctonus ponderosae TaxID=77166 RepID=J3JXK9_DENPD|nr:CDGSH iron-sulfur domain-containing protein 3, mitochondrial [Dendroctonus ponderosae]AEE62940.1 unknown [Dendroctonus ponderosae]